MKINLNFKTKTLSLIDISVGNYFRIINYRNQPQLNYCKCKEKLLSIDNGIYISRIIATCRRHKGLESHLQQYNISDAYCTKVLSR